MYKYLVAFTLITPLIGIWLVEGGEYAGSVGVEGSPNGATVAFACYAMGLLLVAWLFAGRGSGPGPLTASPTSESELQFRSFSVNLFLFNTLFLIFFLFGFGAIQVWMGGITKGEFRANLGPFGAIPNLMTKFIVPALFAYATVLYTRTSRKGWARFWWSANLLTTFSIGASWGFKSTAMMVLLPALLLLYWKIRLRTLIALGLAFVATLVVFFKIFDADVLVNTDLYSFLFRRITVLQGDVAWYVWGLHSLGEVFPSYWPTLLAGLGDKALSLFGASRADNFDWMLYHYDWMLAHVVGLPLSVNEEGHNITGTPFSEGLIAGGAAGVLLFVLVGGFIVGAMYRFLGNALRQHQDIPVAIGATYFCFCIFPWLNGGAITQLFHISLLLGLGATLLALVVMRRIRIVATVPIPAVAPT